MIRARVDITNTDRKMMKTSTVKIVAFSLMIPVIAIEDSGKKKKDSGVTVTIADSQVITAGC